MQSAEIYYLVPNSSANKISQLPLNTMTV